MTEVFPLFVCCCCGFQTFDIESGDCTRVRRGIDKIDLDDKFKVSPSCKSKCCFHTFGFSAHRRITEEYIEHKNDMMLLCRKLHNNHKLELCK